MTVASSGADEPSTRLRDLGVCEGRSLRVMRNDFGRVIVAIDGGRLGVPSDLARTILVREHVNDP